jgi:hypothetical protein
MWLEAILTKTDLETVLLQFSPMKIVLGDNGSLLLAEPKEVTMIPDAGIGVIVDATLHWPILGFDVPVHFRGLTLRVLPIVDKAAKGTPLVFRLQLDHTGMTMLPSMLDHRVTTIVNDELTKKHVELSWNFIETLSHEFGLPKAMASAESISLIARDGVAKATEQALGLAVRFETAVKPRAPAATTLPAAPAADETVAENESASADSAPPAANGAPSGGKPANGTSNGHTNGASPSPAPRPLPEAFDLRSFVVGSAVATAALTTIGGLARLFTRSHRTW